MRSIFLIFPALILILFACNTNSDKNFIADWKYDATTDEISFSQYRNKNSKVLALGFETYIDSFVRYSGGICAVNKNALTEEEIELFEKLEVKSNKTAEDIAALTSLQKKIEAADIMYLDNLSFKDDLYNDFLLHLKVNGKAFRGKILGYHKITGKKILEFDNSGTKMPTTLPCTTWNAEGEMTVSTLFLLMRVRKPIIYLYPEQEMAVKINLKLNSGQLTTTYPKYPEGGWSVQANPDGTLYDKATKKEYYALYWEADSPYRYNMNEGFCVSASDAADFLDEKLELLGLNRREANEFIMYWLPVLEENPYNLIHFSTEEYSAENLLHIDPKPETLIRVMMVFTPLNAPVKIAPQKIEKPIRKGFTAVEWGGVEQRSNSIDING